MWRQAFRLTVDVHRVSGAWLEGQPIALATSIPKSASAMGAHRGVVHPLRPREVALFLEVALRCPPEALHHLLVALELNYRSLQQLESLESQVDEVRRMLISALRDLGAGTVPLPSPLNLTFD